MFFSFGYFLAVFISYFSTSPILLERYLKVLFISHTVIVLFDLFYAVAAFNGIKLPNPFYGTETGFSIYENSTRMTFINLNTLTFSTPILFILFFSQYKFGISKIYQVINVILTIILLILSGRRSVMLMCVQSLLCLCFFLVVFQKR